MGRTGGAGRSIEWLEANDGRTPFPSTGTPEPVIDHLGQRIEGAVDRAPECAGSLAVNDPHLEDSATPAFGDVLGNEAFHIARVERVQIERAVDGKLT